MLAKRSSTLISFGILEKGSLIFFLGSFATGSGGSGGDSSRLKVRRGLLLVFVCFDSASESLEEVESSEESSEGVIFLGPSDNVALVSELTTGFFLASSIEDSLSDSDEGSESGSESGNGIFWAMESFEESESLSESDDEVSLSKEPFTAFVFLTFELCPPNLTQSSKDSLPLSSSLNPKKLQLVQF